MNDFKGFDLNDPGLRAPGPDEQQLPEPEFDSPTAPEPPIPTVRAVRSPFTSAPPIPKGPNLNADDPGILPPYAPANDWQKVVLSTPRETFTPPPAAPPVAAPVPPPPPPGPAEPEIEPEPALNAESGPSPSPSPEPVASVPAAPARPPSAPPATAAPPPRQTMMSLSSPPRQQPSTFQRAVNLFRATMPIVQRVLPLLDGNVGTAVSNLMAPRPQATPGPPQPAPAVNLVPIETGLARLQLQHRELRDQFVEQNSSIKKVQDQLEQVREATDRNTLEQQELLQDLKSVGSRVNLYAYIALALLGLSVLLNIVLFVELRHSFR